ncbi:PilN domain-containing protein [Neorhizobium tomejilense]|uniref:PilN domain-containing protein n=1 Tax=Neorhizobium tomejilense TaxID=2093828 RepID=UPI00155F3D9C|nr:PilN domain-containing protein [Neorhizobium tomejilense]
MSFLFEIRDFFDWWRSAITPSLNGLRALLKRTRGAAPLDAHEVNSCGTSAGFEVSNVTQKSTYGLCGAIFEGPHLKFQSATMRLPFSRSMQIASATVQEKTPFALADIYVLPAPDKSNDRQSSFYVIKRDRIDPKLAEIAAMRPRVNRLGIVDDGQVIWLPPRALEHLHPAFHHIRHWRNGLFAAFAIVLFTGGATYAHFLSRYSAAQHELANVVEAKRSQARQVRTLLDRQQKSIAAVEAARKGKAQSVPVVRVWEELTRILPDNAWLTDIAIDGDMVTITGFAAQSAAALIATLDSSGLFSAANFISPVVRIPGQSGERFEIRLRVQPA